MFFRYIPRISNNVRSSGTFVHRKLSTTRTIYHTNSKNWLLKSAIVSITGLSLVKLNDFAHTEAPNVKSVPETPIDSTKSSNEEDEEVIYTFQTPEFLEQLKTRSEREQQLQVFQRKAKNRLFYLSERLRRREISEKKYKIEFAALREQIIYESQRILYGVDEPHARQRYLELYGCTKCTENAAEAIKQFSPIIEIGAGSGHWQHVLSKNEVDIIAFDNEEHIPLQGKPSVGEVSVGDEKIIGKHKDRTLMLVYPSPTPMAYNCLYYYKGEHLIYVGEGRGGCNADDYFFDVLEKNWTIENVVDLEPFPECFEKLYVLKRKPSSGWFSWLW